MKLKRNEKTQQTNCTHEKEKQNCVKFCCRSFGAEGVTFVCEKKCVCHHTDSSVAEKFQISNGHKRKPSKVICHRKFLRKAEKKLKKRTLNDQLFYTRREVID